MKFDEEGIKDLMAMNEREARQQIVSDADFKNALSSLKTELDKLDLAAAWADIADSLYYVNDAFKGFEAVYSVIDRVLKIRAAAIEAKKICDAGFDFSQIEVAGIRLHRTHAGICEHEFYDETNIPF